MCLFTSQYTSMLHLPCTSSPSTRLTQWQYLCGCKMVTSGMRVLGSLQLLMLLSCRNVNLAILPMWNTEFSLSCMYKSPLLLYLVACFDSNDLRLRECAAGPSASRAVWSRCLQSPSSNQAWPVGTQSADIIQSISCRYCQLSYYHIIILQLQRQTE